VKLSCPSCAAKYSIADEKVQDRLAKIRCRKCSATIIVDGKVNPPSVYTSDAAAPAADFGETGGAPAASGTEYSVDFGDNDQRTMSVDDIVQAFHRGELTAETYVWAEGFGDWQPITEVPELAGALGGGEDSGAMAPRAAARTGSGRGSATDLFGGIERAGSEEDVLTSAPQGGAQAAGGAATGARNESSVLFSLSALTASAPVPSFAAKSSPPSGAAGDKDDDSGLIDLKALTSAVGNQPPANSLMLGTAPLGMAAPLGGMTAPVMAMDGAGHRPASSKTGIYIAAAMVIVGALIAGAIVVTGNKEAPAAANSPAPVAAPAPPPVVEAPKKEEPTAAPPATGTAEAAKDTAPKPASAAKPSAAAVARYTAAKKAASASAEKAADVPTKKEASPSSDTSSSGSSDAPKKKKPPKEKTCNCSAGDLMCAMKCAAS
jgi:predicted Zn finger-like uncharacterized protein